MKTVIGLRVTSDFYNEDDERIKLIDYKLSAFADSTIQIRVIFNRPESISVSMTAPELLLIDIRDPLVFVGADSGKSLAGSKDTAFEVVIPSQMTEE